MRLVIQYFKRKSEPHVIQFWREFLRSVILHTKRGMFTILFEVGRHSGDRYHIYGFFKYIIVYVT